MEDPIRNVQRFPGHLAFSEESVAPFLVFLRDGERVEDCPWSLGEVSPYEEGGQPFTDLYIWAPKGVGVAIDPLVVAASSK